ncbi:MAG: hypothetical protein WAU62_13635 [Dehalococcoidales bacterium]
MPIPRNWSEELACEWLCLEGYSTEVGIPLDKGVSGGRDEADVVGFKGKNVSINGGIIEIYHIEIGQLAGFASNVEMLKKKFSPARMNNIESRIKQRFEFTGNIEYKKLYIDIWERPERVNKLVKEPDLLAAKIEIWTPSKLYLQIFETMRKWWDVKGNATLPEGYWMLKLIENMWENKILEP